MPLSPVLSPRAALWLSAALLAPAAMAQTAAPAPVAPPPFPPTAAPVQPPAVLAPVTSLALQSPSPLSRLARTAQPEAEPSTGLQQVFARLLGTRNLP